MTEDKIIQDVLAFFFDLPILDMGGDLRIVSLPQKWIPVEQRDLIVKAVKEYELAHRGVMGQ